MRPATKSPTILWPTAIVLAMGHLGGCGGNGLRNGAPDAGGTSATGGVTSSGGTQAAGGSGGGGAGGTTTTAPVATGGTAGAGGNGGSVNVHDCPTAYPSGLQTACFRCDALPAGSTDGCGVPFNCGNSDTSSPVRYPVGCDMVFPWKNISYYPNELQSAVCWVGADGIPQWQCLL